jgi:hypothetical protein
MGGKVKGKRKKEKGLGSKTNFISQVRHPERRPRKNSGFECMPVGPKPKDLRGVLKIVAKAENFRWKPPVWPLADKVLSGAELFSHAVQGPSTRAMHFFSWGLSH